MAHIFSANKINDCNYYVSTEIEVSSILLMQNYQIEKVKLPMPFTMISGTGTVLWCQQICSMARVVGYEPNN